MKQDLTPQQQAHRRYREARAVVQIMLHREDDAALLAALDAARGDMSRPQFVEAVLRERLEFKAPDA